MKKGHWWHVIISIITTISKLIQGELDRMVPEDPDIPDSVHYLRNPIASEPPLKGNPLSDVIVITITKHFKPSIPYFFPFYNWPVQN